MPEQKYCTLCSCKVDSNCFCIHEKYYCESCQKKYFIKCKYCKKLTFYLEGIFINGERTIKNFCCDECKTKRLACCGICGEYHLESNVTEYKFKGAGKVSKICKLCLKKHFYPCVECKILVYAGESYTHLKTDKHFCMECWSKYFFKCRNCGKEDEEKYAKIFNLKKYCNKCYYTNCIKIFKSYNFKFDPVFYDLKGEENELYFGIELETELNKSNHYKKMGYGRTSA